MQVEKPPPAVTLRQNILMASEAVILSSTIHGLPSIVRTPRIFNKLVWILFTLASTGGCFFVISRTISKYLDFEATTKIVIYNQEIADFPTVTICNANPFVTQKAKEFLNKFDNELKELNVTLTRNNLTVGDQLDESDIQKYITLFNIAKLEIWSEYVYEFKISMGYSFDDLVINCEFLGVPCEKGDFEEFYDFEFGRCFRFNTGRNSFGQQIKLKNVTSAGEDNGLKMELFVGANNNELLHAGSKHLGARIFITNNTIRPSLTESIEVAVNAHTNIGVTRSFSNRLGPPYSECKDDFNGDDSYLYAYIIRQNRTYRQKDCQELVVQDAVYHVCNCFYAGLENFNSSYKPCSIEEFVACTKTNGAQFIEWIVKKTGKLCPQECNSMFYSLSYSFSTYPSPAYAQLLLLNPMILNKFSNSSEVTVEKLTNSILSFNIHYDLMTYTLISEAVSVSEIDLINNVGGTLGLFLGISLLSFIEFVEIFLEIIFFYFESKQIRVGDSPGAQTTTKISTL